MILPDERDHALAGGVVQPAECQLADDLMTQPAPGQGGWRIQQQCPRERCKLGHRAAAARRPDKNYAGQAFDEVTDEDASMPRCT